jgi:peptidoglycan hydrolase-like protein with peptidoglycan-binding domain
MSLPPCPGRAAPPRHPRGRTRSAAAAALGSLLALAAWLVSQAGVVQAASLWPSGRSAEVREVAWIPAPASGTLRPGMRGAAVRRLQQRLAQLHYYPGVVNGRFGTSTLEAVWAFKEVQGLPTTAGAAGVDLAMRRALARPQLPSVLVPQGAGLRIEVNLAREVLILYQHHQVALISHISAGGGYYYRCPGGGTCGPALTPDGNYRAHWFAGGWLHVPLGRMYNPVFFIGANFAIHGDIPIPLQPASHGCVRIPVDVANMLYKQIRISPDRGTPIYIRGQAPGTLIPKPRAGPSAPAATAAPATPTPSVLAGPALIRIPEVPGHVLSH